jgi:hypothetical protein
LVEVRFPTVGPLDPHRLERAIVGTRRRSVTVAVPSTRATDGPGNLTEVGVTASVNPTPADILNAPTTGVGPGVALRNLLGELRSVLAL